MRRSLDVWTCRLLRSMFGNSQCHQMTHGLLFAHVNIGTWQRWRQNLHQSTSINMNQHAFPNNCLTVQELTLRKTAIWMSKNCQKLEIFFKKIDKNCHFFNKIAIGNFIEINNNFIHFWQFFWKKFHVFGNFLTFKWQFSGGSSPQY